ncbi:CDP-diacylglycerol--inositol 3-phosphatidyltransferase-like [Amblyraja radiata]|uniref:CDP-diacylglycerol--inositol 3-phosphatidyltransferase-like n=1 Tax=Amblyraja radiata TaxID=386614 RepID=UPI0014025C61|nr:CDP-diacylglycerol--inositol 3-phosphatidyltransferase-like [Amblyraja radiata]
MQDDPLKKLEELHFVVGILGVLMSHLKRVDFVPENVSWLTSTLPPSLSSSHSVTLRGAGSHKQIDQGGNSILRYYYSNKAILFLMCVGNELFYMSLYVLYFTEGWMVPVVGRFPLRPIFWACLPVAVAKSGVNVVHLVSAARTLVAIDRVERARGGGGCEGKGE